MDMASDQSRWADTTHTLAAASRTNADGEEHPLPDVTALADRTTYSGWDTPIGDISPRSHHLGVEALSWRR